MRLACTHRSWCAEHASDGSNERLEFLGDAVLGLAVATRAHADYPDLDEGAFSKLRAAVVSAAALAAAADDLGLGVDLRLGKGEEASGGRTKPSILADALEAVVGAVYLDGGWESARALVDRILGPRLADAASAGPGGHDHKTRLQEWAARRGEPPPIYDLREDGPDHQKHFTATVRVGGQVWGRGEGRSKKQAEQAAAGDAWARVGEAGDDATTSARPGGVRGDDPAVAGSEERDDAGVA